MSALTGTGQELIELRHNLDDVVVHSHQGLYDGLRFPPYNVAEGYLRNEFAVALGLCYEVEGCVAKCAAFVRRVSLHQVNGELEGPRGCDDHQCAMLVNDVEFLDGKKKDVGRIYSAVVRLEPLDQFANSAVSDSLYFSFILGEHVRGGWPFFQDGELDRRDVLLPIVGCREMPDDMVEARSQVMDDFSGQNAKSKRNRALAVILDCLSDNLLIIFAENRVFAFLKKPCDLGLKIEDVLVGPI